MRPRHAGNPPEVVPNDVEGGQRTVCMSGGAGAGAGAGGRPIIQPFQGVGGGGAGYDGGKSHGSRLSKSLDKDTMQNILMIGGGIWLVGILLMDMDYLWPVYLVLNIVQYVLSLPPFSWIFGWFYRGAPLLSPHSEQLVEEMQLPQAQVAQYTDNFVNQYGDAALIFASHDGYPQIVRGLLADTQLGYQDLIDAQDETGNTALIYTAAKGFRQSMAMLLRAGADPDIPNPKTGRTALMEAAGAGFKDIIGALRLMPNLTMDAQDTSGNTALHYAAYHGNLGVVMELLKGNANKDLTNIYGHTPLSYAQTNKHKSVVDALNRGLTKSQKSAMEAEKKEQENRKEMQEKMQEHIEKLKKQHEAKQVKGSAEDLHKGKEEQFAPKHEGASSGGGMSTEERHALEEQLAKLRRDRDEAELKSQKRIVELLEKTSEQQRLIDEAESAHRSAQLNQTELQLRLSELESKHRSAALRADEEASRAASIAEQHTRARQETDRHVERAAAAERERDQHAETAKRHEDALRRAQDEVSEHMTRVERQMRELNDLRGELDSKSAERRRHQDRIDELQREIRGLGHTPSA
eukprot:TRINITY_DN74780_c0_g1_i1.p1 TRINITY_DN74780_c0_g1~~TRINITY_DN74780_c0_g1_i1.p1  ORF type:complete len:578 (-),score=182.83 TRINITY_DN74780_c0_g1_i1:203-1936(-)